MPTRVLRLIDCSADAFLSNRGQKKLADVISSALPQCHTVIEPEFFL